MVDVSRDGEELSALIAVTTKAGEPASTATADGGGNGNSLDIGDGRRASEKSNSSGNGGFKRGFPGLPSSDSMREVSSPHT